MVNLRKFNILIFSILTIIYLIEKLVWHFDTCGHINDCISGAWICTVLIFYMRRVHFYFLFGVVISLSILSEYFLGPFVKPSSVSDPLDTVAILLGGFLYLGILYYVKREVFK